MAIRAAAAIDEPEEILFENAKVSLCLLLNRHNRTLRVFDFRAGADPTKRGYVMSLAQREGVERVFTVVERDEVSGWSRLGFEREGTIPGFFKRSDAHVLGMAVPVVLEGGGSETVPPESGEQVSLEHLLNAAKKMTKDVKPAGERTVKLVPATEAIMKRAVAAALKSGRALTQFDRFGRGVERSGYYITGRGGFSLIACVERQDCFDNALIELLTGPRTERDVRLTMAAVRELCVRLEKEGTVACFALSPEDDVELAAIWLSNGFRKTGFLPHHLRVSGRRSGAFLWTRKLTVPAED